MNFVEIKSLLIAALLLSTISQKAHYARSVQCTLIALWLDSIACTYLRKHEVFLDFLCPHDYLSAVVTEWTFWTSGPLLGNLMIWGLFLPSLNICCFFSTCFKKAISPPQAALDDDYKCGLQQIAGWRCALSSCSLWCTLPLQRLLSLIPPVWLFYLFHFFLQYCDTTQTAGCPYTRCFY